MAEERGYDVVEQPVGDDRFNVLATLDPPEVVLSTHIDTVPPFFPSRMDGDRLYGRGSCDAKGILAAQMTALERLKAEGERRVGLLVVVGEEDEKRRGEAGQSTDRGLALSRQRRADRQSVGSSHAGRLPGPPHRVGPSGALVTSRARRVGDRKAPRRAPGVAIHPTSHGIPRWERPHTPWGSSPVGSRRTSSRRSPARTSTSAPWARPADVRASLQDHRGHGGGRGRGGGPPGRADDAARVRDRSVPVHDRHPVLSSWGAPLLFGPGSILVAHAAASTSGSTSSTRRSAAT